jgi:hypothetical protein
LATLQTVCRPLRLRRRRRRRQQSTSEPPRIVSSKLRHKSRRDTLIQLKPIRLFSTKQSNSRRNRSPRTVRVVGSHSTRSDRRTRTFSYRNRVAANDRPALWPVCSLWIVIGIWAASGVHRAPNRCTISRTTHFRCTRQRPEVRQMTLEPQVEPKRSAVRRLSRKVQSIRDRVRSRRRRTTRRTTNRTMWIRSKRPSVTRVTRLVRRSAVLTVPGRWKDVSCKPANLCTSIRHALDAASAANASLMRRRCSFRAKRSGMRTVKDSYSTHRCHG